ncbi:MAG: hypothetical protein JSV44_05000 [Candidatus Zixiibacteriota bacterium]|nr:MAG: hypothetical protein JSV44_05000 [candidate division Zixibacteria bacterium]
MCVCWSRKAITTFILVATLSACSLAVGYNPDHYRNRGCFCPASRDGYIYDAGILPTIGFRRSF